MSAHPIVSFLPPSLVEMYESVEKKLFQWRLKKKSLPGVSLPSVCSLIIKRVDGVVEVLTVK
jgi:hypothetical protein